MNAGSIAGIVAGGAAVAGLGVGTALSFPAHAAARAELDRAQADWDAHPDDHARADAAANASVDAIAAQFGKSSLVQVQADGSHYLAALDPDGSIGAYADTHKADQVWVHDDPYGDITTVDAYPAVFHHETTAAGHALFVPMIAGAALGIGGFATLMASHGGAGSPLRLAATAVGLLGAGLFAATAVGAMSAPGAPVPYL